MPPAASFNLRFCVPSEFTIHSASPPCRYRICARIGRAIGRRHRERRFDHRARRALYQRHHAQPRRFAAPFDQRRVRAVRAHAHAAGKLPAFGRLVQFPLLQVRNVRDVQPASRQVTEGAVVGQQRQRRRRPVPRPASSASSRRISNPAGSPAGAGAVAAAHHPAAVVRDSAVVIRRQGAGVIGFGEAVDFDFGQRVGIPLGVARKRSRPCGPRPPGRPRPGRKASDLCASSRFPDAPCF